MAIPPPPGFKPPENRSPAGPSQLAPRDEPTKGLTTDEASFILKATLMPYHQDDPNVIKFIASYLICRDVKQAAREVGITPRDGENLKRRPDIHEAIRQITEKAVLKYGYDANDIVEKVKEIANVDPVEFENPDGTYKESLSQLTPETRRAIKKFKVKNIYETDPNGMKVVVGKLMEVELWDKMKAVELLGQEKEIFKQKKVVQHDVTTNMKDTLLGSARLADEFKMDTMRDVGEPVKIAAPVIDVTPTPIITTTEE
jgi:hypothetical protein